MPPPHAVPPLFYGKRWMRIKQVILYGLRLKCMSIYSWILYNIILKLFLLLTMTILYQHDDQILISKCDGIIITFFSLFQFPSFHNTCYHNSNDQSQQDKIHPTSNRGYNDDISILITWLNILRIILCHNTHCLWYSMNYDECNIIHHNAL